MLSNKILRKPSAQFLPPNSSIYLIVIILLWANSLLAQTPAQKLLMQKEDALKGIYHAKYKEDSTKLRFNVKLEIKSFYSYHFIAGDKDMNCRLSLGNWSIKGDTLLLVSFDENQLPDKYQFQTLFCKWKDFKKSLFLIKKNKFISLYRNRRGKWRRGIVYRRKH